MLPEIGNFALILAFTLALAQGLVPLFGFQRKKVTYMNVAKTAALGQVFFILLALVLLGISFYKKDFTVLLVYQNTNILSTPLYSLGKALGTHSGILLLWCFFLSIWSSALALGRRELEHKTQIKILMFLGFLNFGFLLFSLAAANPFDRFFPKDIVNFASTIPLENTLTLIQPMILYGSYTAFAVCFALAIIALLEGRLNEGWIKTCRPFALISWALLSLGLVIGSWCSYKTSAMNSWWSWSPLEKTSLLPWLSTTALIHSIVVTEKEGVFKGWITFLIIAVFALMLMGTFIARPDATGFTYTFMADSLTNIFLMCFLGGLLCFAFLTYLLRAPKLYRASVFRLFSRESFLLLNSILLLLCVMIILLGSVYPKIPGIFGFEALHLTPLHYNLIFVSLMIPVLVIMGFAPHTRWYQQSPKQVFQRLELPLIASLLLAVIVPFAIKQHFRFNVFLGSFVSLWILLTTISYVLRLWKQAVPLQTRQWSMILAHLGMAVLVAGITLNMEYSRYKEIPMAVGDTVSFQTYEFTLRQLNSVKTVDSAIIKADFDIKKNNKNISSITAEKRIYPDTENYLKKTTIFFNVWSELYVNLGNSVEKQKWIVRMYFKPFISWIWIGGLMVFLGILLAFLQRNKPRVSLS